MRFALFSPESSVPIPVCAFRLFVIL